MSHPTPSTAAKSPAAPVELSARDLPAHCPNDAMPVWSSHPRVFLDLGASGKAKCPYCGTEYRMRPGEVVHGH